MCKLKTMHASTALSHIKVIDLTRVRAGPTAVRVRREMESWSTAARDNALLGRTAVTP